MKNNKINYSLYLVTDKKLAGEVPLSRIILSAIKGGITIVQYREKMTSTVQMIKEATDLHKITKNALMPLIINDRLDVAIALDAEGVHIGQEDFPLKKAREILGPDKIIGVSVNTVNQALEAEKNGADYLGVGDVFGTTTKKDAGKATGLEIVKKITNSVQIPVVGIGGITKENASSVLTAGANGIAVISAIIGMPDPEKEARELSKIIKERSRYD